MVTFFAKMQVPYVIADTIIATIRNFARSEMRLAIHDFMIAMLSRIPVRTGFLSGSFIKVAAKYGLAHSPTGSHTKPEYFRQGSIKVLKTESSGQQFVSNPEDTFQDLGDEFIFSIESFIDYWRINDFFSRIRGAPWLSIDAGRAAFIARLEQSAEKFPDINDLLGSLIVTVRNEEIQKRIVPSKEIKF